MLWSCTERHFSSRDTIVSTYRSHASPSTKSLLQLRRYDDNKHDDDNDDDDDADDDDYAVYSFHAASFVIDRKLRAISSESTSNRPAYIR